MKNKPSYIKAIEKLLKYDGLGGLYFDKNSYLREATTEELKSIKAACSIETTMRQAEERKGEEREVWCVKHDSYDFRRHATESYRVINEDDIILDAKLLNEGKPTIALHPVYFVKFKVSDIKTDRFDYYWFCTGVICE